MPKKLRIVLWVIIGLVAVFEPVIMTTQLSGAALSVFWRGTTGSILTLGILIIYWTRQTITQRVLKRYLLLAGASAIGILFFLGLHFLVEELMIVGLFVCPVALIVGAAKALTFKSALQAS